MTRRIAVLLTLAALALVAVGSVQGLVRGFAQTFEFVAPNFGPLAVGTYAAERGQIKVWSDNQSMERDPSGTSRKVQVLDGTTAVSEMQLVFTHKEGGNGRSIVETKADLAADRTDVVGAQLAVLTYTTQQAVPIFQFLPDGKVWVLGTIEDVGYEDQWSASGDRRVTVKFFLNFPDWTMRAEVLTRTSAGDSLRQFGPVPMPDVLATEGMQLVRYYVPGGTGQYMIDGMVCTEAFAPSEPRVGGSGGRW